MPKTDPGQWRCLCFVLLLVASTLEGYGDLPLAFERNLGQTDRRVSFLARGSGFQIFLTPVEAVYRMQKSVIRMQLVGAKSVRARGVNRLPGESNYLDRTPSITHVPQYRRVEMREIYRGIDLAYYGNDSQLEYDFVVSPGANPNGIAIDIQGADRIEIDDCGQLQIHAAGQTVIWRAPVAYQDGRNIPASYVLRKNAIGFRVGSYDHRRPLTIDPILAYTATIGGSGIDHAFAVAVDGSECAVITGDAASTNFPTTAGAYQTAGGGVFVAKFNAAGSALIYSTFLGPGKGKAIALQGGNAYITGQATQAFPTTAGAYHDFQTGNNVFVTKLTNDGSGLVYSALFGKGMSDGLEIAVDGAGNAYVTGTTVTSSFTTTANAFQPTRPTLGQTYLGDIDAFFVKLNPTGSTLLYSTYLGSTENDFGNAIAIDSSGDAYVAGTTQGSLTASSAFPTTSSAYQKTFNGLASAFVTKFDPTATTGAASVIYSTLIGGDNESDPARGIAVDSSGNAYITGTGGANFPLTAGAYGATSQPPGAFVTKLNATGSAMVYSALIAGAEGWKVALDASNNAFVAGTVIPSSNFTTVNPLPGVTGSDLFLTKLKADGSGVHYSTYIDGHFEVPVGVAVDPFGAAYFAGTVFPALFNTDAFVAKVVTNRPPIADAGADQHVNLGNSFMLDAGGSSDPDGDTLTYEWKDSSNTVVGTTSTVTLTRPQGVHAFTLTVSDSVYRVSDSVVVNVEAIMSVNLFGGLSGKVTSDDGRIDCTMTGTASCVGRYTTPVSVALTATPGTGVAFTGWKFDCSGTGTCTLLTNSNHTVGAQFDVQQLTLSVSSGANGKVTSASGINCGVSCSVTVPYGTGITLNTVSDSGYLFDSWSGACAGTTMNTCSLTMDANKSAGASFKEITLDALAVTPASATIAIGQQQLFSANGTFSDGSTRTLSGDHSLEATDDYSCAITTSGAVKCWGGFPYQTLTTVPAFEKAVELAAGTTSICALFANGTVNCSGAPMSGVTNAVAITLESGIPCALLSDHTIRCGGVVGPLGIVSGINNAVAIGAEGGGAACAVLDDGTVTCWFGTGDSNSTGTSLPAPVPGVNHAVAVAVGAEHACALLSDGSVKCWWKNDHGQLGDGSTPSPLSFSSTAVSVVGVSNAISVVTGDYDSCALLFNGTVKCWGEAPGNGSNSDSSTPITIAGITNAIAIGAGAFHNCASFANGAVQCWGLNNVGQLGLGNPGTSTTPLPVNGLTHVLTLPWNSSNIGTARVMASGRTVADNAGSSTISATTGALSTYASLSVVNTPTGANIVTKPVDSATGGTPVTVTYASVSQIGSTTLTSSAAGPTPPAGFLLGSPPRYYELSTTASYTAPVTVCFSYAGTTFTGAPQLFHYENAMWKDVTKSIDTANQVICGDVTSFSPFALFTHNHPPVSDAGPDQVIECGSLVTLDGSSSSDPDGDKLTYVWSGSFGTLEGRTATITLPLGVTIATLTVSDGQATSNDTVQITVRDTLPPLINSATADPSVLRPPNHKMIAVTLSVSVADVCDPAARCRIESVSSNEPITQDDWKITGDLTVNLRAERLGEGDGRIYMITIRCTDASKNSSTKTVNVTVPHDQ